MAELVAWLGQLSPTAVYAIAAALIFAETGLLIGLALPGEATLLVVGFLASLGTVNPYLAAVILVLAALGGDSVAFWEGSRYGARLRASKLGRWVGDHRWDRAAALLERRGGARAVFVGRYIAFARTLMPRLCAVGGMPYRRFLGWDVLGVATQVVASLLVGYLAGGSYQLAADLLGRATGAFLLLLLLLAALVLFGRYLGKHPDPVTAFAQRLRSWGPLRRLNLAYERAFAWFLRRAGVGGAVGASILLGVLLLLGAAVALTMLINLVVRSSGIPLFDPLIIRWFADQRSPRPVHAAVVMLSALRGSYLVVAAGAVGLVLNRHPGRWRADVLGVVGTVGAFIPLLILAAATELSPTGDPEPIPGAVVAGSNIVGGRVLYANQVTLATASVGLVAWLLTRRWRTWVFGVAVWLAAVGVVLLVAASRLFVAWNWPSEVVASILLGAAWVTVFVVAWRTRDRLRAEDPEAEQRLTGTPGAR